MPLRRFIGCLLGVYALVVATIAVADGYRVGVNDHLNVQVAIWDEINTVVADVPNMSGSYPVDADGNIALPLAGALTAAELTTAEIASAVEAAMTPYVGIGQSARVAVSVESYAPIYVSGQVQSPGAYDYKPALTVLQATALAGGLVGIKPVAGEERNFLSARGTISVLQNELMYLTAKRARLTAELGGAETVENPDGTLDPAAWAAEEAILTARNARYDHELTSLARARASLNEAMGVLEDKLATNRAQLGAGKAELGRSEDLVERGLTTPIRVFERLSYVNDLESRLLDIERSILLARQEMQALERSEGLLLALRNEENAATLQEVNTNIAETEAQLAGQYDLLAAAAGRHASLMPEMDPATAEVSYTVTRARDGGSTFAGDVATILMPGDVVEVMFADVATDAPSN